MGQGTVLPRFQAFSKARPARVEVHDVKAHLPPALLACAVWCATGEAAAEDAFAYLPLEGSPTSARPPRGSPPPSGPS
jgi:hypothetical protein